MDALTKDASLDWYYTAPVKLELLGKEVRIVLESYDGGEDFQAVVARLLEAPPSLLKTAEEALFAYYRDSEGGLDIASPSDVWKYIEFNDEPLVTRDEGLVYLSLEGSCAWEQEHGVQVVFLEARTLCKVGPYDGHVTNSGGVIYPTRR